MNVCFQGNVLEELLVLLKLEKIEENIFRGQSQDLGFGNVFGGQVLGQALSAASQTVDAKFQAHSIHGYFMRPGDALKPIVYTVDCIRDGKSFVTRRVVAIQKGRAIFSMSASFQKNESGFDHQDEKPDVPGPEGIEPEIEMARRLSDNIPPKQLEKLICEKPIEIRVVNPVNPFAPETRPPVKYVWFKAISTMPDDNAAHRYMLAYASDFHLVGTSLYPHKKTFWSQDMQVASLDHSMWFHREFRMDDWLLYVMKSPNACKGRGLSIGSIFTRDGKLVATVAQEGLIRFLG
ncbi:MAG: acyl-CoA thioesterase II [Pseudomonadota bacterium]